MEYKLGQEIIQNHIISELSLVESYNQNYTKIPIFLIGNNIFEEVLLSNDYIKDQMKKDLIKVNEDKKDNSTQDTSVINSFVGFLNNQSSSDNISCKHFEITDEQIENIAKSNHWFMEFVNNKNSMENIIKKIAEKYHNLGFQFQNDDNQIESNNNSGRQSNRDSIDNNKVTIQKNW